MKNEYAEAAGVRRHHHPLRAGERGRGGPPPELDLSGTPIGAVEPGSRREPSKPQNGHLFFHNHKHAYLAILSLRNHNLQEFST